MSDRYENGYEDYNTTNEILSNSKKKSVKIESRKRRKTAIEL
jgi:lysozyme family protein